MSADYVFNAALIILNLIGILYLYRRLERKIDKKADKYIARARNSKEAKMATEILEGLQKLLKSKESGELIKEVTEAIKEFRGVLQRLSLQPSETEEQDEDLLPSLGEQDG